MTQQDTSYSNEQRRVAAYLNIHPDRVGEHLDTIDGLLLIEQHQGRSEMLKEIAKMLGSL